MVPFVHTHHNIAHISTAHISTNEEDTITLYGSGPATQLHSSKLVGVAVAGAGAEGWVGRRAAGGVLLD